MSDIQFTQGEDVALGLTIKDGAEVPISIAGDTFTAKIKDIEELSEELAVFSFTITDAAAGKVTLSLTANQTLAIPPTVEFTEKGQESKTPLRVFMYDVFRIAAASGVKKKLVGGLVKVYPVISFDGE